MIQPNQLRTGNYVEALEKIKCIEKFIDDGACFTDGLKCNFEFLNPVMFTPEILEKCGFYDDYGNLCFDMHNNSYLSFDPENKTVEYITKDGEILVTVTFLHELQNLHFALSCGKELEINI